jgi:CRP-like cAMP-binding protein
MYCIINGIVGIYRSPEEDPHKRKQNNAPMQFISELKPFDCVGELSVLYGKPRTATAVAIEETEMIVLHKSIFDNIMRVK